MKKLVLLLVVALIYGCGKTESPTKSDTSNPLEKSVTGKIIAIQQGDDGCSVKITDKNKANVDLYVRNDLCAMKEGDVYKFTYGMADVEDCDGAANCKKTKKIEMIVKTEPALL